jgi:hypothetical protein
VAFLSLSETTREVSERQRCARRRPAREFELRRPTTALHRSYARRVALSMARSDPIGRAERAGQARTDY